MIQIAVDAAKDEVHTGDLATKRDLRDVESALKRYLKEIELQIMRLIEKSKNSTLLWMFAMLTGFTSGIIGLMSKGFHWY